VKLGISWKGSILYSIIIGLLGFFALQFYQVIFGDLINKLISDATTEAYTVITYILLLGLLITIVLMVLLSMFLMKKYKGIITSSVITMAITLIILFFVSFYYMFGLFPDLTILEILSLISMYYTLFSVYILESPVYFWYIFIVIYSIVLIFTNKLIFIKKIRTHSNNQQIYRRGR